MEGQGECGAEERVFGVEERVEGVIKSRNGREDRKGITRLKVVKREKGQQMISL